MRILLIGLLASIVVVVVGVSLVMAQDSEEQPVVQGQQKEAETTPEKAQVDQPIFLSVISDVPLMRGLDELSDETFVFDKPGGRIVEVIAAGKNVSPAVIEQFYNRTLPQLGWKLVRPNVFVRDSESLEITVVKSKEFGVIQFSVNPL